MLKPFIYTKDLSVGYHGKSLISDINIGIHKGKILTLIGPNGSGKSTILKNLIRELRPLSGAVVLDGKDVYSYSGTNFAKEVAVVLTERIQTEMMTCFDVVAMGRYPYTNYFGKLTKEDKEIVLQSLEMVHAMDIAEQDFNDLSDGQKQRVMLARAICQQPQVIVLDEPTSFLDIRHKIELLDILRKMAVRQQVTVIMSLHEIDLAYKISDYILTVNGKHQLQFGTPQQIYTQTNIRDLYELSQGTYDVTSGSVELAKVEGTPQIFVLGGCGYGVAVYRMLQRMQLPFATGILYENDIDYPVALALAAQMITASPFEPIDEMVCQQAVMQLTQAQIVIDSGCPIGTFNAAQKQLRQLATEAGKVIIDCKKQSLEEVEYVIQNSYKMFMQRKR